MFITANTDHPRACGANSPVRVDSAVSAGSSPRVRGKRLKAIALALIGRIIPARAGQTRGSRVSRVLCSDHPRACGANSSRSLFRSFELGSSPRVRGKPCRCSVRWPVGRIIPARAGQTSTQKCTTVAWSDHPRACGANGSVSCVRSWETGSSPRVRGKPQHRVYAHGDGRIIPARAGQTSTPISRTSQTSDHPRACGANPAQVCALQVCAGSSPRVRGKPRDRQPLPVGGRIIPARAGQTRPRSRARLSIPDHPRACGANTVSVA